MNAGAGDQPPIYTAWKVAGPAKCEAADSLGNLCHSPSFLRMCVATCRSKAGCINQPMTKTRRERD